MVVGLMQVSDGTLTIRGYGGSSNLPIAGFNRNGNVYLGMSGTARVGIGTTSPDNPLEVVGADSGIKISSAASDRPHLRFECGTAEKLRLSANADYGAIGDSSDTNRYMGFKDGNVGIGTVSPDDKLHVEGNILFTATSERGVYFNNTSGNQVYVRLLGSTELDLGSDNRIRFVETDGGSVRAVFDLNSGKAKVGAGASETPSATWQIEDNNQSTTQTDFTQAITKAGLLIETQYTANAFTPGLFWMTSDNNASKPKAGIYLKETGSGTYIYFGTSNNYSAGITNDGLVLDYSGNVGIGTSAPGAKVQITGGNLSFGVRMDSATRYIGKGAGTDPDAFAGNSNWIGFASDAADDWITFGVHESGVGGGEAMRINYNKRVGIGVSDPDQSLEVAGAIKSTGAYGFYAGRGDTTWASFGSGVPTILLRGSLDNSRAGAVQFKEYDGTDTAAIYSTDGSDGYGLVMAAYQGDMKFSTGSLTGYKMVILSGGNVGIGTSAPGAPLHLYQNSASALEILFENDGAGQTGLTLRSDRNSDGNLIGFLNFDGNDSGNNNTRYGTIEAFIADNTGGTEDGRLTFSTMVAGSDTETMHIMGGNVGIGDDTPENKLTVNGSSRFKDTMFFAATNRGLISWGTMGGGTGFGMQAASGNALSLGANATWDHIVITTAGSVGIGTTAPDTKLHVAGQGTFANNGANIILKNTWSSGNHDILFAGGSASTGGANNTAARIRSLATAPGGAATGDLLFTVNSGDSFVDALYIQEDGNVGIGTTVATGKLQVHNDGSGIKVMNRNVTGQVFEVYGDNGSLFTVSDDLSDSLMSVNNAAGLPVFEAFADNTVIMGQYGQDDLVVSGNNVYIGNATTNSSATEFLVLGANNIVEKRTGGSQGAQGRQGTTGSSGGTGAQGATGSTGGTGNQGVQGRQGRQGTTGSTGGSGAQGATGSSGGTGNQGVQGRQGRQGTTGSTGGSGSQGATGSTGGSGAQGATGSSGGTGNQGVQGRQGRQGTTGSTGGSGSQGATGSTGGSGSTGSQGIQGRQGRQGTTGSTGGTGGTGNQGIQGRQGRQGRQGYYGAQGASGGGGGGGSDYRIKENIKKFRDGYQMVKGINSYTFSYKENIQTQDPQLLPRYNNHIKEEIGFIAHEFQDVAQEVRGSAEFKPVEGVKDQTDANQGAPVYQKIHYEKITPILWGALKDTIAKVEQLEERVKKLENG